MRLWTWLTKRNERGRMLLRAQELENHMQTSTRICCVGNSGFKATCSSIFTTAWANSSERGLRRHLLFARTWCRLYFTGRLCDHVSWDKTVYFLWALCSEVLLKGWGGGSKSANEVGTDQSDLNRILLWYGLRSRAGPSSFFTHAQSGFIFSPAIISDIKSIKSKIAHPLWNWSRKLSHTQTATLHTIRFRLFF